MTDAVEVRIDNSQNVWYCASMIDITPKGMVAVKFDDCMWEGREVPPECVRRAPAEDLSFEPAKGDQVEVRQAVKNAPPAWERAKVKVIKNGFYFVELFSDADGRQTDVIVERSDLRAINSAAPLNPAAYERLLVKVDTDLQKWITSVDAQGCFDQVVAKAGVAHVMCDASGREPVVVMLGEARHLKRGQMLLEVHFKHQREIQRFHDRREFKIKQLEARREKYAASHREEFWIEEDIVGLVIGSKGENLRRVQEEFKVDVHVEKADVNGNKSTRKVEIMGQSKEAVSRAREAVEYQKEIFNIPQEQIGWILGKGRKNLVEFQQKTGIVRLRHLPEQNAIELCGLRQQIDDTLLLLEGHSQYYGVYKEMDREVEHLETSFHELGYKGGKGFKGKGRDDRNGARDDWRSRQDVGKNKGGKGKGKRDDGPDLRPETNPTPGKGDARRRRNNK